MVGVDPVNGRGALASSASMDTPADLRYALRTLSRAPVLAITAFLSLGLGIGANTAVFSFVNAIQFKALPFSDPSSLVDIEETSVTELCAGCSVGTSYAAFLDWRARANSFQSIGAYAERRYVLTGDAGPERTGGAQVTGGLFRMLGVSPVLGREITTGDEAGAAAPVVVLGDRLWKERFAGDSNVLDRTVKVDGVVHTIVGVMPPGFAFPEYARFWVPIAPEVRSAPRTERELGVIGRLRQDATVAQAAAEMDTIGRAMAAEHPASHARWTTKTRSLHASFTEETALVAIGRLPLSRRLRCQESQSAPRTPECR